MKYTFAIGDIHGMYEAFSSILDGIDAYTSERGIKEYTVVTLGDYIDRGPGSKQVVQRIIELQNFWNISDNGKRFITLRGNHEQMYLDSLEGGHFDVQLFMQNGGEQTLQSYGVRSVTDVPFSHKQFFRETRHSYEDDLRYFVHAGVRPGRPLEYQTNDDRLWIREEFLNSDYDWGKLIVHGHTPKQYDGLPAGNRVNLDYGAVFGGKMVCAVFNDVEREPVDFIHTGLLSRDMKHQNNPDFHD